MPSFLYLAPGNERCVVDRLSDIEFNVQFTNPTAGHVAPRLPLFIDTTADLSRTSVRDIRVGDWLALMQDPGASEGHGDCSTWDFAHVVHVRQIPNTGRPTNDMACLTLNWVRGYMVNCPHVVQNQGVEHAQCCHHATADFHVISHQHDSWWCLFHPIQIVGSSSDLYNADWYQQIRDETSFEFTPGDVRHATEAEMCEYINHGLDHQ